MIRLLISVGNIPQDYTANVDGSTLQIEEASNIPTVMTFSLIPTARNFQVPPQRAYVQLYSTLYERSLFTGFISCEPERQFLAKSLTGPIAEGNQLFRYNITCTSDEYILNVKAVPFIPAFVNRSEGEILSSIANVLCPGMFDTSMVASGSIVPFFDYSPKQSFSEIAKQFGDGSRYRYKARDKMLWYQPFGDLPLGIDYDERKRDSRFAPQALDTSVLKVPIVNDVTMLGDVEAGNNREDYFLGDGFTATMPLLHKVFRGSGNVLLQESWNGTQLNLQQWFLSDPGDNFDFTAGALNLVDTLSTEFDIGTSFLALNNGLELAGGIDIQLGEITFNDFCDGMLGGIYTDTSYTLNSLVAAFKVATPGSIVTSASGAAGITIEPFLMASGGIGPVLTTKVNHNYVLQITIHAPRYSRYTQIFRTLEGEPFGGVTNTIYGSITWRIQDYDIGAATGVFYQPDVTVYTLDNVPIPPFVAFALINNKKLNLTLTNTTVAYMPLGGLLALTGPCGLFQPTGLILPMLPPSNGSYQGPVPPWPSTASGSILPPPFGLKANMDQQVLGSGFNLQAAQITPGNSADTLNFYVESIPAAGTPIRLQSWEAQAAVSRLQDENSIIEEAFVVGDDGLRSAIVSDLNPLPRTSEDCDNAALAFLKDRVGVFYNGSYHCTSLFFEPLTSDLQFYPTVGRFFNINSPARQINQQKTLVVGVTIKLLDMVAEWLDFTIKFGADLYLEKTIRNFVDIAPQGVLTAQDKANPPDPRFTQNVTETYLPDLDNVQADVTAITPSSVKVNVFDPYFGPIEIRRIDANWGKDTADLIGFGRAPSFTIPRQQYDQVWFLRPVDDGGGRTSRRSKVIRVRWPLQPTGPIFVGANGAVLQFSYDGDVRNIYGFELRAFNGSGVTVIFQQPQPSTPFFIDITQTPFVTTPGYLGTTWTFYAYFFNAQWDYSVPTRVEINSVAALLSNVIDGYFHMPIIADHAKPDLANGTNQLLILNQAGQVTIDNPIFTGGQIRAGQYLYIYIEQDATGGRPTPLFGPAFGSDVTAEQLDGTPLTRSVYGLTFHNDGLWHIDVFSTGRNVT